ncbi:MAG: hypothetical protein QXP58_00635 [Thermoprotei archaeon]
MVVASQPYIFIALIIGVVGLSIYTMVDTSQMNAKQPYVLTLIETGSNYYGPGVPPQPRYYVLGPNGLGSSADIRLPAHRLIELVIISYDVGNTTPFEPKYANVTGTVGGIITLVNGTEATGTGMGVSPVLNTKWEKNVTGVPIGWVDHTFTIAQKGGYINIPVVAGFTEIAYLYLNETGSFAWGCMCPCGYPAMTTPGWMMGTITVY